MPSRTTRASLSSELGSGTTTPPVSASRRQSRRLSALESSPPDESLGNDGITRDSSGHILEVDDSEADDEILASSPVLSSRKRRAVATPKRAPATPAITSAISSSRKYKQAEVPDSEDPMMNDEMDSHVDVSGGELSSASKRRRVTRTTSSPIQKGKGKVAAVIKEEEEVVDLSESEFEDESDGGGFIKDDSDSDALLKTAAAKRKTNKRKAPAKSATPVRKARAKKPIVIASDEDEAESSTAAARRRARAGNGDLDALPDDYSDDEVISVESKSDYSDDEEEPEEEEEEVDGAAAAPRRRRGQGRSALSYNQKTREALYNCHPALKTIFNELDAMPKREMVQVEQPEELTIKLLPFQREGLHWLVAQENSKYHGGILADEMGMGKTIQTIALLLSEPRGKPNLVVVPTVAIMQWKQEIESNTAGKLTTMVYHGASRTEDPKKLEAVDVIITSYNVLESVFRKEHMGFRRRDGVYKARSALHAITYHRVILDEAHNIKERQCNTAKAAFALKTERRLCLSGTPLQNRIGELYSLIRFLRIEPFSNYFCKKCPCTSLDWMFSDKRTCDQCGHKPMQHANWFNTELLKPIQNSATQEARQAGMMKLHSILRHTLLRRTKLERADDLGLPPRIVDVRRDRFNEEEEDLYRSIYSDGKRRFSSYVAQGVVLNNYANIFTLITRMRQMADHPDLVLRRHGADNAEDTTLVCKICDDEAQEAIRAKCHHVFCRLCIREYVEGFDEADTTQTLECPVCHVALVIDLTAPALEVDEETLKKGSIVNRIDMSNWRSSTKIEALVEELYKLRSDRQTIKSIVFSQFTSMLDLVEWRLRRAGFLTVKLQGSMTPTQRDNSIKYFMNTPSVEVFLVSLKAGGVALNLCEASQVFLLDPWWNPSVEWQSGDRVHRIGQHRPVRITRLIIEDSIESRIIELQEKKANMIRATIESDDSAMNRLTPADLEFLFMN